MKRFISAVLSTAMLVSVLAGCNTAPKNDGAQTSPANTAQTATPSGETPATEAKTGGEITVNLQAEPPDLFSVTTTTTGSGNVLRHVMDGLVGLDAKDNPIPAIAKTWDISEDGTTYTFHLRDDAKWTNGEPVTAKDFVFAWDLMYTVDTGAEYAGTWAPLIVGATEKLEGKTLDADTAKKLTDAGFTNGVGYQAVDDYTFKVMLTGPYPYFLGATAFYSFYPLNEKGYNEIGKDNYALEAQNLVTNGPFKITEWTHEDSLVLEKDPTYFDAANVKLDKITMMMVGDYNTAYNGFRAGDLDETLIQAEQRTLANGENVPIYSYDDGSTWYFEFGTKNKGLNNVKVREALTKAIDVDQFVKNVLQNGSSVAYSFVPTAIEGGAFAAASGKMMERVTDGDYSKVKALLEEGLKEEGMTIADFKPSLISDDNSGAIKFSAFFQEQWKSHLGLDVQVETMTYKNRIARMQARDISIVMAGWGPDYNDPMTFLDLFVTDGGNNHTSWSNPEYDKLVKEVLQTSNVDKRNELMHNIEKIIMTEFPVGPVYNRKRDYVLSDKFDGVIRTAFQDMNFRETFMK